MNIIRQWVVGLLAALAVGALVPASAGEVPKLKGTVVDTTARAVEGAIVEIYAAQEDRPFHFGEMVSQGKATTDAQGSFALSFPASPSVQAIARKPGLALAWKSLSRAPSEPETFVLSPPGVLGGVVVDETDNPVGGAEVCVGMMWILNEGPGARNYVPLYGRLARECFNTRTGAGGHFRIDGFPTNATASLMVRMPGKAVRQPPRESFGPESMPWHAGQEDIRLVVESAGAIEGRIVAEDATSPMPAVRLSLSAQSPRSVGMELGEPVTANADGTFRIPDLGAGQFQIHAMFGTNTVPDWVAEAVPVSVESGQTTRDVKIQAIRGGLLEVFVHGKQDRQGMADITLYAYRPGQLTRARTDQTGAVCIRVPPGDYQLVAQKDVMRSATRSATVEAGKTNRLEIELAGPNKLKGVVRQPGGQPAAGLPVRIIGVFGHTESTNTTGVDGRFELDWNTQQYGGADRTPCLLIRDPERSLAVAQELDEDSSSLELRLEPALTIAGRAECDGKPVTNAIATLIFWTGNSGMHLQGLCTGTNQPGQFEIRALPPGRRYGVIISAPGHGQKPIYTVESGEAKKVELDPIELKPANLTLAGQVVDADDKPWSGASVNLSGDGQPTAHTRTDREGHYSFPHVCEGPVRLYANARNLSGHTVAEGGDTNVVIRLGESSGSSSSSVTPRKLMGLVTDPDNQPVAGAQVAVLPFGPARCKTDAKGAFSVAFTVQPWQLQSGGDPQLVVRDFACNLAAVEDLTEEATNVTVQLKPALTLSGRVEGPDGSPLTNAQVGVWLLACRTYSEIGEQLATTDARGQFEIKTVPAGPKYTVYAKAKDHGRQQQEVETETATNRLEMPSFVLKVADQRIAGQVIQDNEKPVSGVQVRLSGQGQPEGSATTDSKGRFSFKVCDAPIRLFASGDSGYVNASAEPGDTNIVLQLSRSGSEPSSPRRASLKGKPPPDLATAGLAADALPAAKPLLICLFDAEQRPSRRALRLLAEQHGALTQQGVGVVAVQAVAMTDAAFNEWKASGTPPFPVGRITAKSPKTGWATEVQALPWLILSGTDGRVIAEGFPLDELNAKLEMLK